MGPKSLFLLFGLCMLTIVPGCKQTLADRADIEAWMATDPKSCVEYYNTLYPSLAQQGKFGEAENCYARIFRAMPGKPGGDPERLAFSTGQAFYYYYRSVMQQNKKKGSEHLTDSLLHSDHPFFKGVMEPELIAITSRFLVAQKVDADLDSLKGRFLQLEVKDGRRQMANLLDMSWCMSFILTDTISDWLVGRALALYREGYRCGRDGDLLTHAGYLALIRGRLEEASLLTQEAVGWYIVEHPEAPRDRLIETYNNLTRIYLSIGLHDKALEVNSRAIACSKEQNDWCLEDVYRLRAGIMAFAQVGDSAIYWSEKVLEVISQPSKQLPLGTIQGYQAAHIAAKIEFYPDSAGQYKDEIEDLLANSALPGMKILLGHYYGQALLMTPGREQEGIRMLEEYFRLYGHMGYGEQVLLMKKLLNAYIKTGKYEQMAALYPQYAKALDEQSRKQVANAAIGANVRYETGRKEQENKVLAAEVKIREQALASTWIIAGLLIALLLACGLYFRQRQRYHRRVSEARLSRITSLLDAQQELDRRNSLLSKELKEVSIQKKENSIRTMISTSVLNPTEEANFRRSFTALHPGYLSGLHSLCPGLTRTDELIAMLLFLSLSNDEIALTLSITKASVIKARSRMRKRLGLDTGVVLEEYLKGI